MTPLHWIDYTIIFAYLAVSLAVGLLMSRRASRDGESYFLGGRSIPWWINGISLAATSFASDTPLAVTEMVRGPGLHRLWWLFASVMVLVVGVFLFARLWRRLEAMTDAEFCELRYDGRAAAVLRVVRAFMSGVVYNLVVIAWVTLGMASVITVTMPVDRWTAVGLAMGVTVIYTIFGGFFSAVITDLIQFVLAVVAMMILAFLAVSGAGGLDAVLGAVRDNPAFGEKTLSLVPSFSGRPADLACFLILLALWWGDAGGYVMQRMSAARNEDDAVKSMLFFAVWQSIRPWLWVPIALVSIKLFPVLPAGSTDTHAYPLVMNTYLGIGLRGLLITAFAAAFMSTITTHLNWGASYLMRDGYARFIRPAASERELVLVSRLLTVGLAIVGIALTPLLTSISQAWEFLAFLVSGSGVIAVFRWFWWRINAWTELTAIVVGAACAFGNLALNAWTPTWMLWGTSWSELRFEFKWLMFTLVVLPLSLIATLATKPVAREKLVAFYRRVQPGGWWSDLAAEAGSGAPTVLSRHTAIDIAAGLLLCAGAMLAIGYVVLDRPVAAAVSTCAATLGGFLVRRALKRSRDYSTPKISS